MQSGVRRISPEMLKMKLQEKRTGRHAVIGQKLIGSDGSATCRRRVTSIFPSGDWMTAGTTVTRSIFDKTGDKRLKCNGNKELVPVLRDVNSC